MSSGVPAATMRPPCTPARGPMSMTWSAARMVSSSCSTTSTVLPRSRSRVSVVEQARVVALVQADRRLVEDVEHADQRAADLRRQPDALRLAARQRRRRAVERQVVEPDVDRGTTAGRPISRRMRSAISFWRGDSSSSVQEVVRLADGQRGHLGDALVADLDEARLLAQARAVALLADGLGHVAVELVVDRLEVLVGGAPLLAPPALVLVEAPLAGSRRTPSNSFLKVCLRAVLLEDELDLLAARALAGRSSRVSAGSLPHGTYWSISKCAATASRIWWKKALLRRSHGSIAPSRSDSSSSGTIRSGSKNILAPMPSQAGQAPAGLLNENSRGVISG